MSVALSVCICTFNRAPLLAETLLTVAHALEGTTGAEVLVVDNNSSDGTSAVVRQFQSVLPVRYAFEPVQGLARARNTAVRESRGALIAFTDDDTLWRAGGFGALASAAAQQPGASFFAGRMLPWWADAPPRWLHDPGLDLISGVLGHYDLGTTPRALGPAGPLPFGANFALRRSLLAVTGPFDERLGAVGRSRRRGEETDLLQRAVAAGLGGYYVPAAFCLHRVDPHELSLERLFELGVQKGLLRGAAPRGALASRLAQGMLAARGLVQLARGRGDRFRQCVVNMGIEQGGIEQGRMEREHG